MKTRRKPAAARRRKSVPERARVLALDEQCTIARAGEVRSRLVRLLEHAAPVTIDAGRVERVDTACLQLLTAFVRDRRSAGREVTWRAPTAAFLESVTLLGLGSLLGTSA
jgi:ABC-type transporter Mla MlaB component